MDIISTTEESLNSAYLLLKNLSEDSDRVTVKCARQISANLSFVDVQLRKELMQYIKIIEALNNKLKYCVDENMVAISDRLNKIPEYEKLTYKKRNII